MKKYNLKLNLSLLTVLGACLLTNSTMLCGNTSVTTSPAPLVISQALSESEVQFIAHTLDKLSEWVQYSKKRFDLFFNKENKESYTQHVAYMYQDLAQFHADFIVPVEKELAEHQPLTPQYEKVLKDALSLMQKFETNLVLVHKLLNNPKFLPKRGVNNPAPNKLAMGLAAELKKFGDQSEKQGLVMLEQVKSMQKELMQYNPVLAQKITALTLSLNKLSQNPPKPITLLNGLAFRFRCSTT